MFNRMLYIWMPLTELTRRLSLQFSLPFPFLCLVIIMQLIQANYSNTNDNYYRQSDFPILNSPYKKE